MNRSATRSLRLHRATIAIGIASIVGGLVLAFQAQIPQVLSPVSPNPVQANTEGLHDVATEKVQRGDYQSAIADYDQVLRISPQDADAYYGRGVARLELGDYQSAIADYNQVLRMTPQDADAYYNRGVARYRLGRSQAAIEDWSQALRIDPNLAEAYGDRGFVRAEMGDTQAAVGDLQRAAKLFFNQGRIESYHYTLDLIKQLQQ